MPAFLHQRLKFSLAILLLLIQFNLLIVSESRQGIYAAAKREFKFDLNKLPDENEDVDLENEISTEATRSGTDRQTIEKGREGSVLYQAGSKLISKLPDYFDFRAYMKRFNREEYKSASEWVYRKAIFFKRCMQIFKSRLAERMGRFKFLQSYQIDVNKFTDRSPNEIKQMFMSAPPIEFRPSGQPVEDYLKALERTYSDKQSWDLELSSQATLNGDHGDGADADDADMTFLDETQIRNHFERLLKTSADDEYRRAMLDEIDDRTIETDSQADLNQLAKSKRKPLPWPFQAKAPTSESPLEPKSNYRPPKLRPGQAEYLDWSEHPCFHTIYDQKDKCGKCYVMATTALSEFYMCAQANGQVNKRKFSKEYVLDCAIKFQPATIYGCKGGSMIDTLRFISSAGIYNIRGWRNRLEVELSRLRSEGMLISPLDEKCPLNEFEMSYDQWGEIRVDFQTRLVHANDWLEALQDGPLVASVQMPEGVEMYKSGVHDGQGCATSRNWHTMLLVGYGLTSGGVPYWRFRNSFGPDWGDEGHFNLAMAVPGECLMGGARIYRP